MEFRSESEFESKECPGVVFRVRRMSYGRRLELLERVRPLAQQHEFHQAGKGVEDKVEGAREAILIDRCYFEWGLVDVRGLVIDGVPGDIARLWDCGPEPLVAEIVARIKDETGLSEDERKN